MICGDTPHLCIGVWVVGWMGGLMVLSGQITINQVNLNLIEIIQFFLNIYDL